MDNNMEMGEDVMLTLENFKQMKEDLHCWKEFKVRTKQTRSKS